MRNAVFSAAALLLATLPVQGAAAQSTATRAAPVAAPISDDAGFTDLDIRSRQLVAWFNGDLETENYFSDYFLNLISKAQMEELRADIIAQHGKAVSVTAIEPEEEIAATVRVLFEDNATGNIDIVVARDGGRKLMGFLLTGFDYAKDDYGLIDSAFAELDGKAGYAVAEITDDGPVMLHAMNADQELAIGSAFKLYVLAELAAEVRENKATWQETIPLSHKSLPSGIMQDWPGDIPVSMATLAALMISISDNSATDTLIHALGREQIGGRLAKIGHGDPNRMLPLLTTMEAFALKMKSNDASREAFLSLPEDEQAEFLDHFGAAINRQMVRDVELVGAPTHIDTIEWFASPGDMVGLLTYLMRLDDPLVRDILAINPGLGKSDTQRWAYLGYKGGSEPGVINMSFLGRRTDGRWLVITGSWNNDEAQLDETYFAGLMSRLTALAAD